MDIQPYTTDKFDQCLAVFNSNLDRYFVDYEFEQFKSFLKHVAPQSTYFVLTVNGEVAACGGYEEENHEIILTWGMVRRDLHGQGYGRRLTQYRLNAIQSKYPNHPIKIDTSQHTQGFYKKLGFHLQAIKKDGYGPGLDQYMMTYQRKKGSTDGLDRRPA